MHSRQLVPLTALLFLACTVTPPSALAPASEAQAVQSPPPEGVSTATPTPQSDARNATAPTPPASATAPDTEQPEQEPSPAPAEAASCGRLPNEPIKARTSRWGPHPLCDRINTTWANVPKSDRVCKADSDCVLKDGNCFNAALNVRASTKPEYQETPCPNPAAGACGNPHTKTACVSGCCQVVPDGTQW
jgi:hypothetical protein